MVYQLAGRLVRWLDEAACASFLALWLGAVWRWLGRQYHRSLLHILVEWRSLMDKKLGESVFGHLVDLVLSLPERLLGGGGIAALAEEGGSRWTAPLLGATLAALLAFPYEQWNNYYALYLVVAALALVCLSRQRAALRLESVGFWPLAFALVTAASVLWSADRGDSMRFLVFAAVCMLAVLCCAAGLDTETKLLLAALGVALGLVICCGYGVVQKLQGIEPNAHYTDLSANANMPGRVYSFFDNPNSFANIPVLFTPLMLALVCFSPKLWQKLAFGLGFGLGSLCLILTYTRGAWLAWLISLFVFVLIVRPRLVPWLLAAGVCCLPLLPDSILNRMLSIFTGDSSISSRGPIYMAILRLIKRNAVLGVGLGSTNLRDVVKANGFYTGSAYFVHGHNLLFQIWGESGFFALLAYGFATFFPVKNAVRAAAGRTVTPAMGVAAGAVSGLIGAVIFGLTDYIWSYPRIMILYWFLFGLMLAAVQVCRREADGAGQA